MISVIKRYKSSIYKFFSFTSVFLMLHAFIFAQEPVSANSETEEQETGETSKKFEPGKLVMEHIADSHEWHIYGSEENPTVIPLPVIIYSKEKGLNIFSSGNFYKDSIINGEKIRVSIPFKGYKLEEGKVVSEDGSSFYDLSITKNVLSIFFCVSIMLLVFISVARTYARNKDKAPSGLQNAIEPVIMFVRDDIAKAAIGEKHHARFMPYLLTIFFFIWISNLLGLIPIFPGGANVTGNIAVPIVLASFTLVITLYNGNKNYWRHILAMPGVPIYVLPIITLLEVLGIFLKPFVLVVRLFANILAGHIVILVFFCLIFVAGASSAGAGFGTSVPAIAFTIFINGLELLVGFLQAFVFTFLTAIYFGMALVEDEHH